MKPFNCILLILLTVIAVGYNSHINHTKNDAIKLHLSGAEIKEAKVLNDTNDLQPKEIFAVNKPYKDESPSNLLDEFKQRLSNGQSFIELDAILVQLWENKLYSNEQLGLELIAKLFDYEQLHLNHPTAAYLSDAIQDFWPKKWLDLRKNQLLASHSQHQIQHHLESIVQWIELDSDNALETDLMSDTMPLAGVLKEILINTDSVIIAAQIMPILAQLDPLFISVELPQIAGIHDSPLIKKMLIESLPQK